MRYWSAVFCLFVITVVFWSADSCFAAPENSYARSKAQYMAQCVSAPQLKAVDCGCFSTKMAQAQMLSHDNKFPPDVIRSALKGCSNKNPRQQSYVECMKTFGKNDRKKCACFAEKYVDSVKSAGVNTKDKEKMPEIFTAAKIAAADCGFEPNPFR